MAAMTMILSAAAVVVFVRFGLLRAVDNVANAMEWNAKARGQLTGYATSVPEFVCLVAAGLSGVWEAGLWNIASSNIINCTLLLSAAFFYRQVGELFNRRFFDEVLFAAIAVVVPIVLMSWGMDAQWYLIPILLGFFAIYRYVDHHANRPGSGEDTADTIATGNLPFGIILGTTSIVAIAIAGMFLGSATANVVEQVGMHPTLAGWILGVVTSLPEMVTFFSVYAVARRYGTHEQLDDTQEALDNLTGSNMANVGFAYPLGLLAYLIGSAILA